MNKLKNCGMYLLILSFGTMASGSWLRAGAAALKLGCHFRDTIKYRLENSRTC